MKLIFALAMSVASASVLAAVSVKDDVGATIALAQPAKRIISLAPHVTEDLFAIGAGKLIVGAVNYSDYPPEANQIERIGGYNGFDLERIRALKPDLIIGWATGNPERQLDQIKSLGIPVFLTFSKKMSDVPTVLERLGTLSGNEAGAAKAAKSYRDQLAQLERTYAGRKPVRVFYQIWDRPLMTINNTQIISDVMRVCGGVNVFGTQVDLTPKVDVEAVLAANPDVVMTSGEPGMKTDWLVPWKKWKNLKATQNNQFYMLPKDSVNRMGPRLVEGGKAMCEALEKARQ
ncbi:cobalamin-binding protein [Chitinibacter bivalviorum]|uniref:Cobalamin-binding protein n=1 Tax=Chitinibacter bivalviorum TaxID=2739434 RepID=A0A7H9BGR1_9NEIS|nr:cobalamin-binding protein [Chitinibacter bivalviorum]QLG87446.1 cobalamin-binding protein [Chitinibacter bivalviorum]